MPRYTDTPICRYTETLILRYTEIRYTDAPIYRHSDTSILRYFDTLIYRHTDHQYDDPLTHRLTDPSGHEYRSCCLILCCGKLSERQYSKFCKFEVLHAEWYANDCYAEYCANYKVHYGKFNATAKDPYHIENKA